MKPLPHFRVSPEFHHDRGAGVESMDGVIGVFPPPLNFPGVRTLRAFCLSAKRERLFPIS